MTTGSVNSSLGGEHSLVILAAFMGMLIQSTPGGKGVGLMYMVMYIIITVFIVGLMSGRTPEYLGMKITGRDVKLVMVAFLIHPLIILVPTVLAFATGAAAAIGLSTNAAGFTQVFYEFTSAAANNGSDFLGASGEHRLLQRLHGDRDVPRAGTPPSGYSSPWRLDDGQEEGRRGRPQDGQPRSSRSSSSRASSSSSCSPSSRSWRSGPILAYFQGH